MDRIRPPTGGLPVKKHWSINGDCKWMYVPYELVHASFFLVMVVSSSSCIWTLRRVIKPTLTLSIMHHLFNCVGSHQFVEIPNLNSTWGILLYFTRSLPWTYHKILVDGQGSKEWSWTLKWLWKPSQPRGGGTSHQWYPIPPNPQPKTFSDR